MTNTSTFEALLCERKCGNTNLGEEIYLAKDNQAFARMLGDADAICRARATEVVTLLNSAIQEGARPPKLVREDRGKRFQEECERNRKHIADTRTTNFNSCRQQFDWLRNLLQVNGADSKRARQVAAEMYGCRQFVLGVIAGRSHMLSDKEQEDLKRSWEDQWDTEFGDLVGTTLGMH